MPPAPFSRRALVVPLALCGLLGGSAVRGQSAPDAPPVALSPRVAPSALYSGTRGFGVGAGVAVENLGWGGSQVLVDGVVQQRFRSATVSLLTGDPRSAPGYGVVTGQIARQVRRRYVGVGPFADPASTAWLTGTQSDVEARLGVYPLGHSGLRVEPGLRLLTDRIAEVDPNSPVSLDALGPASADAARAALGTRRTALSAGVAVAVDLRDSAVLPARGSLAEVEVRRVVSLDGSRLRLNRVSAHTEGFLPVGRRTTLFAQASGVVLRQNDRAGVPNVIPLGLLPALDDRFGGAYPPERYLGRDVLMAGLGVRQRLVDGFGLLGLDALVLATVGNAYDDVTRQFSPSVSFRDRLEPDADGRAPLRPGLVVGLGLVRPSRNALLIGGQVGVSPGGLTFGFLSLTADLGRPRPRLR